MGVLKLERQPWKILINEVENTVTYTMLVATLLDGRYINGIV